MSNTSNTPRSTDKNYRSTACKKIHYRCRTNVYPFRVERLTVPDEKVPWDTIWADYKPPMFTSRLTKGQPWADPDLDGSFSPKWNALDGPVNRRSYTGSYEVRGGLPTNPVGRTGLGGRGVLGRWGPNHAADAVVTRWKRNESLPVVDPSTGRPVLQLVTIRKRSGEWGIPGGMIEPGESPDVASRREFTEEVLDYEISPELEHRLDVLFSQGVEVYQGYIDDPRNTDHAWVETVAYHYHDDGHVLDNLRLVAGDDACNAAWIDVDRYTRLFSTHHKFLKEMTTRLKAHF